MGNNYTDTQMKMHQEAKDKAKDKAKQKKVQRSLDIKNKADEEFALNLAKNATKDWISASAVAKAEAEAEEIARREAAKAAEMTEREAAKAADDQLFKKLSKATIDNLREIEERYNVAVVPVSSGRRFYGLTDEEQVKCAHDYYMLGSLDEVASKNNVNKKDLVEAAKQNWWKTEVNHLHREAAIRTKMQLTNILNLTLDQLEDRVRNGDVRIDMNGEEVRYPVSAQNLATITNVIFDKKIKLEDRSNGIIEGENKRLVDLANSLTMLVVKDAEVINDATSYEGNENE